MTKEKKYTKTQLSNMKQLKDKYLLERPLSVLVEFFLLDFVTDVTWEKHEKHIFFNFAGQ